MTLGLFTVSQFFYRWRKSVPDGPTQFERVMVGHYAKSAQTCKMAISKHTTRIFAELPIPAATIIEHRLLCDDLAQALIWLHGPATARKAGNAPVASMRAYFEQWLNGLVYELFFPDELHGRKLTLFAETARLNPPDLSTIPDPQKLARLRELFEQAYDSHATLRSMLFSLRSLEVVRIIEEPLERSTDTEQDREL